MKNGMSSLPSDVSSPDDALSAEVGMVFENGEHRVIQNPVAVTGAVDFNVLFIHDFANYTHLIGVDNGQLAWGDVDSDDAVISEPQSVTKHTVGLPSGVQFGNIRNVNAVGNTLIFSTSNGLLYFLWKDHDYAYLGNTLPSLHADYVLENHIETIETIDFTTHYREWGPKRHADVGPFISYRTSQGGSQSPIYVPQVNLNDFKNAVVGHISDVQNQAKEKGLFIYPFMIRVAYQLYDGENAMVTNPVLMLPCVRRNDCIIGTEYDGDHKVENAVYFPHCSELKITINIGGDIDLWKDIITGVDVYMSDMVCPFDINGDWNIGNNYDVGSNYWTGQFKTFDGIFADDGNASSKMKYHKYWSVGDTQSTSTVNDYVGFGGEIARVIEISPSLVRTGSDTHVYGLGQDLAATFISPATHYSDAEIIRRLIENSQYYRALEIDLENMPTGQFKFHERLQKNVLLNLTSQHMLKHDDYFGHCPMDAEQMFTYNGRLHLGAVTRGFFEGFHIFFPSDVDEVNNAKVSISNIRVAIESEDGTKIVETSLAGEDRYELVGYWFYYPDPRAKEVTFILSDNSLRKHSLKPHPWLHGAYFFLGLPEEDAHNFQDLTLVSNNNSQAQTLEPEPLPNDNSATEYLPNQLLVSEVSNPFLFTVDGAEEIGSGRILGLVSNTEAVSEGQFGQYPLYAFTSEGIWALSVKTDGTYDTIRPLSREVCNNPKSIVQTDKAVYFTADKGLMRIVGSQVACVSQQMMGKRLNPSAMERHDDEEISLSVVGESLIYNTANVSEGMISGAEQMAVVGESLIFGGDGDVILLNSITPFEQFIRPTENVSPRICYDYRNSRLWLFREDSDWVYVHSMKEQTFALYSLPSKLRSAHIIYPDTWLQNDEGRMLSMGKIPFIDYDENEYTAMLLTRPVAFGSPFTYKQIQQLEHLSTKDSSDISIRLFGSNNTREWHEEMVVRGRPYRYFRFLVKMQNLSATDAYSSMMVMTEQRRNGRLHPEDWHTEEVENTRPLSE